MPKSVFNRDDSRAILGDALAGAVVGVLFTALLLAADADFRALVLGDEAPAVAIALMALGAGSLFSAAAIATGTLLRRD